ncbi:hypothetical protein M1C57_22265 [Rhodococcus pyridinivorans]|uniref:hypothetical protein n=1 Tax=Rhodococcus pyridinivorans TaxID=103816 RepID=UPI00200AD5E4|nr:hypothetical protein [Rhodococcus pyridinivorans]UPW04286.1 hypothetical protein M1C57_22265 [Rhodococcus pyridinivorans]
MALDGCPGSEIAGVGAAAAVVGAAATHSSVGVAKGDVLDPVITRITRGRPYRHVMGFEAGEQRREDKDALFNTDRRTGEYPLIDWGWSRADAIDYTRSILGTRVGKSACTFCPFSFANKSSRAENFARYAEAPEVGARTLLMEHLALALNPAQGLVGGRRLIEMLREHQLDNVLDAVEAILESHEHAIYEIRRILRPRKTDPTELGDAARSVRIRGRGPRAGMHNILGRLAADGAAQNKVRPDIGDDGNLACLPARTRPGVPDRRAVLRRRPGPGVTERARQRRPVVDTSLRRRGDAAGSVRHRGRAIYPRQ